MHRVIDENYGIVQLVFEEYDIVHIEVSIDAFSPITYIQTVD